jgi:DNA-binding cell septation regulator SpoVG
MVKAKNPDFKTKAFFSIVTKNFVINDCRLVRAESGKLVVLMPYREYMDRGVKKFMPIIHIQDVDYLEAVGQEAVKVYESLR